MWSEWHFQDGYRLWVLLGLSPSLCDQLVDLELRWEFGSLCVHARHRDDTTIIQRIEMILLMVWDFREWTDSRWLTLGPCCRSLRAATLLGLDSLVHYTLQQPHVSGFQLGMYEFDQDIANFVTQVAASSHVSDAALAA